MDSKFQFFNFMNYARSAWKKIFVSKTKAIHIFRSGISEKGIMMHKKHYYIRFELYRPSKINMLLTNGESLSWSELNLYRVYIMEKIVDAGRIPPNLDYWKFYRPGFQDCWIKPFQIYFTLSDIIYCWVTREGNLKK